MILVLYFFKRFFKYLFLINISLTILFNFIEFFEKIIRIKHTSINIVLHFILLNLPPSFFETLPISCWLATCFLIKEFAQHNEWEIFQILSINYKKLFNLFFLVGIILFLFSFIGKEYLTLNLLNKSERFKLEKFKQNSQQKILNKWLVLSNENLFCFFRLLDLKTNLGTNLMLLYMNQDFEIDQVITCKNFKIHTESETLILQESIKIIPKNNFQEKIEQIKITSPSLFSQIQLYTNFPSFFSLMQNLISCKNILPKDVWNELFAQLLKKIYFHLQLIIYPLLTFYLFFLFPYHPKYKWILILLPYPILIILNSFTDFIIQKGICAWITIIPYLILIIIIFLYQKKLEKSY